MTDHQLVILLANLCFIMAMVVSRRKWALIATGWGWVVIAIWETLFR